MKKSLLSLAMLAGLNAMAVDLRIAYESDPVSHDPMEQLSSGVLQGSHLLFDPLLRHNSDLQLEPRLAEKWEQLDDKTIRMDLRQGVKFHSGNDLTVEDVIWTFERFKKSADFKGLFINFDKIVKVNDTQFDVVLKEPYPLALQTLSYFFVMDSKFYTGTDEQGRDKSAVDKSAGTFASTNISGTGPFTLESREQGIKVVYVKNPNYWAERGNVDRVILTPIQENATRVSALISGDLDWIYPVPVTELERVAKLKDKKMHEMASDRIIMLQLNQGVVPEFKDVRVRQAVNLAVNNAGIVEKIMRGYATAAGQLSPKGYVAHNEALAPEFDLKKAQQLMKEAGHEKGFTVTMISPNDRYINDEKIAQAVASMLAKINIKVELTTMPKAQYWNEFDKCASGIQLIGWSSDTGDSANYSEFLTATRNAETGLGQFNCGGFSIAELDELLAEASKESDGAKRKDLLQKVTQIERDQALVVPLHWQNFYWGYSDKLENFPAIINLKNFPYFGDLKVKE